MTPDMPVRRDDTPWSSLDSSTSLWPTLFGFLLLVWSWWQASGSASVDDQTGSAVIGILGIGVTCYALASWLRAGKRAVDLRRQRLMELVGKVVGEGDGGKVPVARAAATDGTVLVTYPGANRYHRSDCLLVVRKPTVAVGTPAGSAEPCEMCRP